MGARALASLSPDFEDRTSTASVSVVTIDDADAIRRLVKMLLELQPGIAVVAQGADGQEGVALVAEHQPDVVLLDVSMPVMNGLQALPLIREASPHSRVVMLSGFGTQEIKQQCADHGAVDFIDKGVIATQIVRSVQAAAQIQA